MTNKIISCIISLVISPLLIFAINIKFENTFIIQIVPFMIFISCIFHMLIYANRKNIYISILFGILAIIYNPIIPLIHDLELRGIIYAITALIICGATMHISIHHTDFEKIENEYGCISYLFWCIIAFLYSVIPNCSDNKCIVITIGICNTISSILSLLSGRLLYKIYN